MATFQESQRRLLRERCERLCNLVDLNAPPAVLNFSAGHLIRALVYSFGPAVLADVGERMIAFMKLECGICPHCPEERPSDAAKGMCAECWASCKADDDVATRMNAEEDSTQVDKQEPTA